MERKLDPAASWASILAWTVRSQSDQSQCCFLFPALAMAPGLKPGPEAEAAEHYWHRCGDARRSQQAPARAVQAQLPGAGFVHVLSKLL